MQHYHFAGSKKQNSHLIAGQLKDHQHLAIIHFSNLKA